MDRLGAQEDVPGIGAPDPEPPDPWDVLPSADEPAPEVEETASGPYRGRRRATTGRRTRLAATTAVVAAVGVVLIGSSAAVQSLSAPVDTPVVPPSATPSLYPSPSPSPAPLPPTIAEPSRVAGLGEALPSSAPPTSGPPEPPPPTADPPEDPPPEEPPEEPSPEATEPAPLAFEAEAADRGDRTEIVDQPQASGGQVVDLDGDGGPWRRFVRFSGITVDQGGRYELTVHYTARRHTEVWISVNGSRPFEVDLAEPSGNTVGTGTVRVELAAGDNTITVSATDDRAPNLDLITITGGN